MSAESSAESNVATASKPRGNFDRRVSTAKETLSTFREFVVVLLVLVVALFPETIRHWMDRGRFEKFGAAGLEVTVAQSAQKADQKVGEAQQQIQAVAENNQEAMKKIDESLARGGLNDEAARALSDLKSRLSASSQTLQTTQQDLAATRQAQETVLQKVAPALAEVGGRWGVVLSGDKDAGRPDDIKPAKYELDTADPLARQVGGAATALYDRQGWFRTVIEFRNARDAQDALPEIRRWRDRGGGQRYSGAYAVNIDEWCANRQQDQASQQQQLIKPFTLYKCPGS